MAPSGGAVLEDINGNGVQDAGDTNGIANWFVTLIETNTMTISVQQTAADGSYLFQHLPPGGYRVTVNAPIHWASTLPVGESINVTLALDQVSSNNLFLDTHEVTVSGFVIQDTNGNGTRQAGENYPIPGALLQLLDTNNLVIDSVLAGADGSYSFFDVHAGSYHVLQTPPVGYSSTSTNLLTITVVSGVASNNNNFLDAATVPVVLAVTDTNAFVTYDVAATTVNGTNNAAVVGTMTWTNSLTGQASTLAAALSWAIPGVTLNVGTNVITVYGTNAYGFVVSSSVTLTRGGVGTGSPFVDVTNVNYSVNTFTVAAPVGGTNNMQVFGSMRWTNLLSAANGTLAVAPVWSFSATGLAVGTNTIVVYATNILGVVASDSVVITRQAPETLTIVTSHGSAIPAVGIYTNSFGDVLTNTITGSPVISGGTQYVSTGWAMTGGNDPAVGVTTSFTMTHTNNAVLTWLWNTNYQLSASAGTGGTNAGSTNGWYLIGSSVTITGVANVGYHFMTWSGNTNGCTISSNTITATMDQARTIAASFALNPEVLTIVSVHGTGTPVAGVYTNLYNSPLTNGVSGVDTQGGTQYVGTGWSMTGNAPFNGATTNMTMTQTNDAVLTWLWLTNYQLSASAVANGNITGNTNGWYLLGSSVTITGVANVGYHFLSWGGNTNGCTLSSNTLSATMDQARTITATFALNPEVLTIVSAHGTGTPAAGIYTNLYNTDLTNAITGVDLQGGTQYVSTGWSMAGNAPFNGGLTNFTMTQTNDAVLTWLWLTNYQLSASAAANGSIAGSTNGWYLIGSSVTITGVANVGYHFSAWSGDTNGCTLSSNTLSGPMSQARTISATFALNPEVLTIVSVHGTGTPAVGIYTNLYNTPLTNTMTGVDLQGGTQYVSAGWVMTGNTPFNGALTNFTMTQTNDAVLTWQWQTNYLLNASAVTNGSVVGSTNGWYLIGSSVTITGVANLGYHFQSWAGDTNGCTLSSNVLSGPMSQARAITATFALNPETLAVISAHGTGAPAVGLYTNLFGTVLTNAMTGLDLQGGTQYVSTGWAMTGGNDPASGATTNFTMTHTNNAVLTWLWQTNYLLNASAGTGGTNTGSTNGWYLIGSSVTITGVANLGYHFNVWSGNTNGCTISSNTISATMDQARSITASFALNPETLTIISAHGTGTPVVGLYTNLFGTVLTNAMTGVDLQGGTQYVSTGWVMTGGNDPASGATTNFTMTHTNNAVLTWLWQTNYLLNASAGTGGANTGSTNGWYLIGSSVTVTGVANLGYHFMTWSGNTNGCTISSNTISATMDQARSIAASFALNPEMLTIISAHGTGAPAAGSYTNLFGTILTNAMTGTDTQGGTQYVSTGWAMTGGNDPAVGVTTNFTMTHTNNAVLTWLWKTNYQLGASAGTGGTLTGSTNGWYLIGSSVTITGVANVGYHFMTWSGNTNGCTISSNTITATMDQARTIAASFALNPEVLTIVSVHGVGTPAVGVYTNLYGTVLTNAISSVDLQGATQYVATGWTLAGTGASTLLTESFENGGSAPAGWATENPSINTGSVTFPSGGAYDGTYSAAFEDTLYWPDPNGPRLKMVTPVSTVGRANIMVDFAATNTLLSPGVDVEWSTDGATWNLANTFYLVGGWSNVTCALPVGAEGQATLYVAFRLNAYHDYYGGATPRFNLDLVHITANNGSVSSSSGGGTSMVMTATNDAVLTWQWNTNYLLNASAVTNGSITGNTNGWYLIGSSVTITGVANVGYHFLSWGGNTNGSTISSNTLSVNLDQARTITATFALNPEVLTIVSVHGTGTPAVGTYTNLYNTLLTNGVSGVDTQGGTQYVGTGWSMTGNAPFNGVNTNMTMTQTNDAVLTWLWLTNYQLSASAAGNGSVTGNTNGWYLLGSSVTITGVANVGYHFVAWGGNTNGCTLSSNTLSATMDQARTITATFALNPEVLTIVSAHGTGTPAVGIYTNLYNTDLTNTMTGVDLQGGTQYVSTGWTMTGNTPFNGALTNFTMTQTNAAVLTWQWQTNYLLNAAAGIGGTNTGSTNGWYLIGSSVTITGVANLGYHFNSWAGDTNGCTLSSNVLSGPMSQARAITATFALNPETLVVISAHGTGAPAVGLYTNLFGTVLTNVMTGIDVQGRTQYVSTGWVMTGGNDPASGVVTNFTMTHTNNAVLTWLWNTNYYLSVSNTAGGVIDSGSSSNGWYAFNQFFAISATNSPNYHFVGWSGDTNGCAAVGATLFGWMLQARTIVANFALNPETLTIVSDHGPCAPVVGVSTNLYGTILTNSTAFFDRQGGTQYVSTGWTLAGNDPATGVTNTFTMTHTNNAVLTWLWKTNYVLVPSAGVGGSVTGSVRRWYLIGSSVTITGVANMGYHFANWSGDTNGCTISGNVITGPMGQARMITANFALATQVLTVVSDHGPCMPVVGVYTNPYGAFLTNSTASFDRQGGTQYVSTGWVMAGNDSATGATNTFTMTHTNTAVLTWLWNTNYVLVPSAGVGGSVTGSVRRWYLIGSSVTITGVANVGYHFANWSGDTNGCTISSNVITGAMVQARMITANFALDTHVLTVASDHGGASPGTSTNNWGSSVSQFVVNSPLVVGGTQYVCTSGSVVGNAYTPVSATNVTVTQTNDATLTWQWITNYQFSATTNGGGAVSGSTNGWYLIGSSVTITGVANVGYHFVSWSGDTNGSTIAGNTITATMGQARSITATFARDTETLTIVSDHGTGTPPAGVYTNLYGAVLSNSVTPVDTQGWTQYVATGWTLSSGGAGSATLLTESFENGGSAPAGWATETVSGANHLYFVTGTYYPSEFTAYDGSRLVMFDSFDISGGVNRLKRTSPISTLNRTNVVVDFAWLESSGYAGVADRVDVEWSTNGSTWSSAGTFNRYNAVQGWKIKSCTLPSGAENQPTLYVAFRFTSMYGNDCYLDLVHVTASTVVASVVGGTGPSMVMTQTNNALLTWLWQTNYYLSLVSTNGSIISATNGFNPAGSSVNLYPVPTNLAYYGFDHWMLDGSNAGTNVPLNVTMDQPHTVQAVFADHFVSAGSFADIKIGWAADRAHNALFATVTISNRYTSTKAMLAPVWFEIPANSSVHLANPTGIDTNTGYEYVNVSSDFSNRVHLVGNHDFALNPGEVVTLSAIKMTGLHAPTNSQIVAVWADASTPSPGLVAAASPESVAFAGPIRLSTDGKSVEWDGQPNWTYTVEASTDLRSGDAGFHAVVTGIQGFDVLTVPVVTNQIVPQAGGLPVSGGSTFYRVKASK